MRDPAMALVRALARRAPGFELDEVRSVDWASATFTGWRHVVRCSVVATDDTDAWTAALAEEDIPLPGCVLADLRLVSSDRGGERRRLTLEALTVVSC